MIDFITNKKTLIVIGVVMFLIIIVGSTYSYFTIDVSNSFSKTVDVSGSTSDVGSIIITSNNNNIYLNLTAKDQMAEAGTVFYGSTNGTPSTTPNNIEIGTLSSTVGAALCDINLVGTYTNKELVNSLSSTGELVLEVNGVDFDLYTYKNNSSFDINLEDVYVDTSGSSILGDLAYYITEDDQNGEAAKSFNLEIDYGSMICVATEEISD